MNMNVERLCGQIEEGLISIDAAFELIKAVDYHYLAVEAIIKRSDCPFSKAFSFFDESDYDTGSSALDAIIKRDDWKTIPLDEVMELVEQVSDDRWATYVIIECDGWKKLPIEKAMKSVDLLGGYYPRCANALIKRDDCSLEQAFLILYGTRDDAEGAVDSLFEKEEWQTLSFDDALNLIRTAGGGDDGYMVKFVDVVFKRNDFSIKMALELFTKLQPEDQAFVEAEQGSESALDVLYALPDGALAALYLVETVVKKDEWRALPFDEAYDFVVKTGYDSLVIKSILARDDCPTDKAELLRDRLEDERDV